LYYFGWFFRMYADSSYAHHKILLRVSVPIHFREVGAGVMDGDVFSHRKRPREDVDTQNSTARVVEAALAEVKAAKLSKERRSLATPKDVRYTSGLSLAALKDGGDAEGLTLEVNIRLHLPEISVFGNTHKAFAF
jgi:hypothetical protein